MLLATSLLRIYTNYVLYGKYEIGDCLYVIVLALCYHSSYPSYIYVNLYMLYLYIYLCILYIYIYSVFLLIVQLIPLHNIAAFINICRFLNQCC